MYCNTEDSKDAPDYKKGMMVLGAQMKALYNRAKVVLLEYTGLNIDNIQSVKIEDKIEKMKLEYLMSVDAGEENEFPDNWMVMDITIFNYWHRIIEFLKNAYIDDKPEYKEQMIEIGDEVEALFKQLEEVFKSILD
ncbi:MAG: hypothetical protein EPN82_05825 [Bacteroidetes bacterium]|nr:MAG: hypothetical protein EPN82_05825 [Bacteroidota bacterium]